MGCKQIGERSAGKKENGGGKISYSYVLDLFFLRPLSSGVA